jgi:hypothetical protein
MAKPTYDKQLNLDGSRALDVDASREKINLDYLDKWNLDVLADLSNSPQEAVGSLKNNFHVTFVLDAEKPYLFIEDFSNWKYRNTDPLNVRIGIKAKAPSGRVFYTNIKDDSYVNSPDLDCESVNYSRVNNNKIYLPLLDSGNPERGEYKIEFHERKLVDGASWTSANVSSAQRKVHTIIYDYQYVAPEVRGSYDVDISIPVLKSIDTTDYNIGHKGLKNSFKIISCIQYDTDKYAVGVKSHASQPLGGVFPEEEFVVLHENSNSNGVYKIEEVLGYGDADNISALSGADSTAFYFVVEGLSEMIDELGYIATKEHRVNFPSQLGVSPAISYNERVVTNDFYTQTHTTNISNRLIWKMNDNVSIVDAVSGSFSYDVVADADLCDVYCCLEDIYNRWQSHKLSNDVLAKKMKDRLYEALIYLPLLKHAIDCKEGDRVAELREKIIKIADCDPGCFCDDKKPTKVFALLMNDEQEVVEGGNGISVSRDINSGIITYRVGLDYKLYNNIRSKYETVVAKSGSNIALGDSGVPGDPLTGFRDFTINYTPTPIDLPHEIFFSALVGSDILRPNGSFLKQMRDVEKYTTLLNSGGSGDLYSSVSDLTVTSNLLDPGSESLLFLLSVSDFGITDGKYSVQASIDVKCLPNEEQTVCEGFDNLERYTLDELRNQLESLNSGDLRDAQKSSEDTFRIESESLLDINKYDTEVDLYRKEIALFDQSIIERDAEIDKYRKEIAELRESDNIESIDRANLLEAKAGVLESEVQELQRLTAAKKTELSEIQKDQSQKILEQAEILDQLAQTKEEKAIVDEQYKAAESLSIDADALVSEATDVEKESAQRILDEQKREEASPYMFDLKNELLTSEQSLEDKISTAEEVDTSIQDLRDDLRELEQSRNEIQVDSGQIYGDGELDNIDRVVSNIAEKQRNLSMIEKYSFYPVVYDKQNSSFKIRLMNLFSGENFSNYVRVRDLAGVKLGLNILITKLD